MLACLATVIGTVSLLIIIRDFIPPISPKIPAAHATVRVESGWPTLEPAPTQTPSPTLLAESVQVQISSTATRTKLPDTPTAESTTMTPTQIIPTSTPEVTLDSVLSLLESDYPPRDYFESAGRLSSKVLGSRTVHPEISSLGDSRIFFTDDGEVEAELKVITDHTYFWFETSLHVDQQRIEVAAQTFEDDYYPLVTALFGQEWLPGIDNDPRFTILHLAIDSADNELGFFNSGDEYPQSIYNNSNEREMIYLNMNNLRIGSPLYFGTLVHEYLHLIQWYQDPNEPIWFSEGLAQFVELYVGLDTVDSAIDYSFYPSIQLNSWEYDDEDLLLAHYGAAYLFTVYIWEQLGEQALVDMVRHPADGLGALHNVLPTYLPDTDIDQFFTDWLVANYFDQASENGRYGYRILDIPRPAAAYRVDDIPTDIEAHLNPYSADYVYIKSSGNVVIDFYGDVGSDLFPEFPYDDNWAWFVPGLNETDATLSTTIDLTDASETVLNFWTWYELEEDFDFAYLTVSADGGQTWEVVAPDHAVKSAFGPALSGRSESAIDQVSGWVKEQVSLWRYAGQEVIISFEVLTDSAITEGGFAVGGINLEGGDNNWDQEWSAHGFVKTTATVPKSWSVQLVQELQEGQVTPMLLNSENGGSIQVQLGEDGAILIVAALGPRFGNQATYRISFDEGVD